MAIVTETRTGWNGPVCRSAYPKQSKRYVCWARAQTRYMLGDGGPSYLVGYGKDYSKFPQVMGASCPGTPFQGKAKVLTPMLLLLPCHMPACNEVGNLCQLPPQTLSPMLRFKQRPDQKHCPVFTFSDLLELTVAAELHDCSAA